MPIVKTFAATETVTKLVISWLRDDSQEIQHLDYEMVLDTSGRSTRLDVQATYENLIKNVGCTPEQARQQTAGQIERVDAWAQDKWTYVGCMVQAFSEVFDGEVSVSLSEAASDSLWGIESFWDAASRKETVKELEASVRDQIASFGFDISDEEWAVLPREDGPQSYYGTPDTDPGENATPLPELPESTDDFTYTYALQTEGYGSYDEYVVINATCLYCGEEMHINSQNVAACHMSDCEYFAPDDIKEGAE